MRSTIINTSKEMMCYSDFPIPQEYPIFMHNSYVQGYFNLYAEKFVLRKHIRFRHEVIMVSYVFFWGGGGAGVVKFKIKISYHDIADILLKLALNTN